jgi:hypothetical protein
MTDSIATWMRDNALGVSGYSALSFVLQINFTHDQLNMVGLIAHINVYLAFGVGAITLAVKGLEFIEKLKKSRRDNETKGDS